MKGLGYVKGQENLLAGEDGEYPDWLWGLLDEDEKGKNSKTGGAGDEFGEFGFPVFGGVLFYGLNCLIDV